MLAFELIGGGALAAMHVFGTHLRFLDRVPRSQWLSAAAGVSVGYVFAHLLPELAEKESELAGTWLLEWLVAHQLPIFVLSLGGLLLFFGLERLARHHKKRARDRSRRNVSGCIWACSPSTLSGGIVLNVLKEELPSERESRFWPFALGACGYAALLLTLA